MIPAYIESLKVVRNGSAGLRVIGFLPAGSGPLTISSSRWFCQKQRATATPSTLRQTMMRVRSSSRCSTRVRRSSNCAVRRRATALGAVVGYDFALDGLAVLGTAFDLGLLGVVILARDRRAELTDSLAHRLPELGEALRPEYDQGDDEDDGQLEWSNVRHLARW